MKLSERLVSLAALSQFPPSDRAWYVVGWRVLSEMIDETWSCGPFRTMERWGVYDVYLDEEADGDTLRFEVQT